MMLKLVSAVFASAILAAAPASSMLLMTPTVACSFSAASSSRTVSCRLRRLNRSGRVGQITSSAALIAASAVASILDGE